MKKLMVALGLMLIAHCAAAESTNITGSLFLTQNLTHKFTDDLGIQTKELLTSNKSWTVSNGITTNQMNLIWSARLSLTNLATKTYDLAGGLTNRFGKPITFTGVKWLEVVASGNNKGTMSIGNELNHWASFLGASNQTVKVRPDTGLMFICPGTNIYTVTATTGDLLKIKNDAAVAGPQTNSVDIFIGGIGN